MGTRRRMAAASAGDTARVQDVEEVFLIFLCGFFFLGALLLNNDDGRLGRKKIFLISLLVLGRFCEWPLLSVFMSSVNPHARSSRKDFQACHDDADRG